MINFLIFNILICWWKFPRELRFSTKHVYQGYEKVMVGGREGDEVSGGEVVYPSQFDEEVRT